MSSAVDAIKDWQATRAGLDLPSSSADHLFTAMTNRHRHLASGNLSRCIRSWVDSIPVLDSEKLGAGRGRRLAVIAADTVQMSYRFPIPD